MSVEQQKRVLVVDDDQAIRQLLVHVLRRYPLLVDEACDGQQALELIREHQYAVILLDLLMPVLDGFGVLDVLGGPRMPSPPVVLVITGADRGQIERLHPRLVHGIVRKPFDAEEIAAVVVACAEIRGRNTFGAMAIATMLAGSPLLALLDRFST
ncbi:MAG TPA: response regulator [Thermoanaerobaculia bacterium]|nr:response regulator [Thermoanaerobaculia bacterium]